eukprot:3717565-Rhodomonas_salina.3
MLGWIVPVPERSHGVRAMPSRINHRSGWRFVPQRVCVRSGQWAGLPGSVSPKFKRGRCSTDRLVSRQREHL